jgi:MATE family multidrug resistance protein
MFQVVDGVQVSVVGSLRGLKDTRVPMLLTLIAYWLLGLPTGVGLAFGLNLDGPGLWFGLVVGLTMAAILLLERFRRAQGRLSGLTPVVK